MSDNMTRIINDSFTAYAGAVLQSRALVDVRDCLKPSARQIFYCLYTDKFLHNKPFQKTIKALGSAMRVYIHGDSSAEGVLMRAGQNFAMRYPLVDVEGNGGTLAMSGNWAAARYTSSRLTHLTSCIFDSIEKETIKEWRDNYDDTEQYPAVLPSKGFYNIVNGTMGIGIGAASSIPQFNIKDVNNALEHLLLNPDCDFEDIYCPPDFATGGILINEKEVKESLKNGTGSACKLRAKMDYNQRENCLVVTELPYSVYTNTICGELEGILESEDNPGIDRFNDLTGSTANIKIYLTKDANVAKVTKYLYKNTSLQYFYGINMTMLDKGKYPKVFTWKEALQAHIDHEKEVYRNGFLYDISKIEKRIHIIDGLLICLASIDEVVKVIKASSSTADASQKLQANFKLDEVQAKAVLDMKLSRLAHLEVEKLKNEKNELVTERDRLKAILENVDLFNKELINTWKELSKKYGDAHRTQFVQVIENDEEEEIPNPEDVVVIVTRNGKVKRVPKENFKVQRKNGKGVRTIEDAILTTLSTNTIDTIMFFTNNGKVYRLPVNEVPEGVVGVPISSLVEFEKDEEVIAATSICRKSKDKYVLFFTKNGMIKKTAIDEYFKTKRSRGGLAAIKLSAGDTIANVVFADEEEVLVVTKNGMSIRFDTSAIAAIGRMTVGVKAIKLDTNDEVLCGLPITENLSYLAIFTTNGIAKRTDISEYPVQGRGGKGVLTYKSNDNAGGIIGAALVTKDDNILLCGKPNSICVSAADIPTLGRAAVGNQMIKSSKISSIVKI